ncbi:MAG: zinc dependent phospholipase C family protein [Flavobacteriales bacterium]|nr:zinc dependent phospholipase C family protein [Flavobacteriales bacterium]
MKKQSAFICCLILLAGISVSFTSAPCEHWGFFGHKKINEIAVYTLPEPMFGFYKKHVDYLIDHSVDPDKRRYGMKGEAECHYIDADHYCFGQRGCNPFENIPRRWTEAIEKYGEDSLREHGIVPWHVNLMTLRLTKAFREENVAQILRLSAELGHYVGDAHVPLHTTSNYNGQQTGQRGIHGFWESRLPELYHEEYDFFVGKAQYIDSPLNYIWDRVEESYAAVDTVLGFEADLNSRFPADAKYAYETRGAANMKVYSEPYSRKYTEMLDGQVERRMRSAVISIGSLWYTAWVDAGQPDLDKLAGLPVIEEEIVVPDDPIPNVREHE